MPRRLLIPGNDKQHAGNNNYLVQLSVSDDLIYVDFYGCLGFQVLDVSVFRKVFMKSSKISVRIRVRLVRKYKGYLCRNVDTSEHIGVTN